MVKKLFFIFTFFAFLFPVHAETVTIPDPTFSLIWYSNSDYIYSDSLETLDFYCSKQNLTYVSHIVATGSSWTRTYYENWEIKSTVQNYTDYISSITCDWAVSVSTPTNTHTWESNAFDYSTFFFKDLDYSKISIENEPVSLQQYAWYNNVFDYTKQLNMQNVLLYNILILLFILWIFQIVWVFYPIINDFLWKN